MSSPYWETSRGNCYTEIRNYLRKDVRRDGKRSIQSGPEASRGRYGYRARYRDGHRRPCWKGRVLRSTAWTKTPSTWPIQRPSSAFFASVGPVDILVNCAGGVVGQVHHPIEDITDEQWSVVFDANLTSTFNCTRAVVPGMKKAGWGRIVNISSGAGRAGGSARHPGVLGGQGGPDLLHSPDGLRARPVRHHRELHHPGLRPFEPDDDQAVGELRRGRSSDVRQRNLLASPWRSQRHRCAALGSSSRRPRRGSAAKSYQSTAANNSFNGGDTHAEKATWASAARCPQRHFIEMVVLRTGNSWRRMASRPRHEAPTTGG